MAKKTTTITLDDNAQKVLEQLKKELGLPTNALAFQRALQMLKVASENADDSGIFAYKTKNKEDQQILLR